MQPNLNHRRSRVIYRQKKQYTRHQSQSHYVLQLYCSQHIYCNLPETTTAVCRNCVKKWENWIKSETQQKFNPGLFAGVANHPPAAAVAFCLFTLCLWFKAVLICPFDSFSSSSSPSLLSLYCSYDFLDYMLFVSSPTWFSLLVDSEARLLQSAQDSTAVPQPTMPKNEESKPVGMIKSSRV